MTAAKQQQVEQLDTYWSQLLVEPSALPPDELDAEIAAVAAQLRSLRPPRLDHDKAQQLQERFLAQTICTVRTETQPDAGRSPRWRRLPSQAALPAVAFATMLILALTAAWVVRPQPVSAQEIVQRARATATSPAASNVRSFATTAELSTVAGAGAAAQVTRSRLSTWYQAPNKWRYQFVFSALPTGAPNPGPRTSVTNGQTTWTYEPNGHLVQITAGKFTSPDQSMAPYGNDDLAAVLQQAGDCDVATLTGKAAIAGRATDVITLVPAGCSSPGAASFTGSRTIWVDQQTFFVLQEVAYSPDGQVLQTMEVTHIQYNTDLPGTLFTFIPPPGADVHDDRPGTPLRAAAYQQQLALLAKQADFPLFAPGTLPSGLRPWQPQVSRSDGLQVDFLYNPPNGTSASSGQGSGVRISERRATYSWIARWTAQGTAVSLPTAQGWIRDGVRQANGSGTSSTVVVLHDGTLTSLQSFTLSTDELLRMAASLVSIPGGHASLPNPTPPTLSTIRQGVSYPIFVPTAVPEGLVAGPPVGGDQPEAAVSITYRTRDGKAALKVLEGPAGCCLAAEPASGGQAVALPNALVAHSLTGTTQGIETALLWWQQDGAYIAISGRPELKEDMLTMAGSMSKTANLLPKP